MKTSEIVALFKEKGLKATPQRIAVYKFLAENRIHPDVETVYNRVSKDNPSFSKTTVYNCLQALAQCKLIIPVKIDADKIRYDAGVEFHGHFRCEKCGQIYDFDCGDQDVKGMEGFDIRQKDVYYSGICKHCNVKFN
ncbi:MAG: transcriptional repressor [Clostridiales bacterium]|nr:transcriptional repressor [Clostridiales bacterium]